MPEQSEWRPEAGWYPNPENRREQRYWDGERWTDERRQLNIFDRIAGAGHVAGPGTPQFEVGQIATGLAILGAALAALSWALPATVAPGVLAGTPVEGNKLGEQIPWFWPVIAALVTAWSAFRAQRDSIRVWVPLVFGAVALLLAIGLGTSEKVLTLYPLDSRGGPVAGSGVLGDPGAAIYVLGVGGLIALVGGLMIRASEPLGNPQSGSQPEPGQAPRVLDNRETKECPECAERVSAAARVCKHCGNRFELA